MYGMMVEKRECYEVVSDLGLCLRAGDGGNLTGVLLLPPLPVGLLLCEVGDGEL